MAVAFLTARSDIGADVVRSWAAANLPAGASIVDVAFCDVAGLRIIETCVDVGGNHYCDAVRVSPAR
ncbi:hypothetical protein [Sandarakinorhabdus sp. DWP1-3-1]|uniref:hypothetical protein n=1 Tax=Sandarakinorhabdus sp. DWP1-3-1 TaxID=2804627 RepID=UPI003CEBEDF5